MATLQPLLVIGLLVTMLAATFMPSMNAANSREEG